MKKEWDVRFVQMLANDVEMTQISKELDLSYFALAKRLERLKKKWGCKTPVGLVATYFRNKIIE